METLIALVIVVTSIWVFFDAKALGVVKTENTGGPWAWLIGCVLLWIVVFPLYLAKRPGLKRANAE